MYAIFISGGKQHKVKKGQTIRLEKLKENIGNTITFNQVLMISNQKNVHIGSPILLKSSIEGYIKTHGRHKKIKIIKFNRRKHYKKKQGHRQWFTDVIITKIKYNQISQGEYNGT